MPKRQRPAKKSESSHRSGSEGPNLNKQRVSTNDKAEQKSNRRRKKKVDPRKQRNKEPNMHISSTIINNNHFTIQCIQEPKKEGPLPTQKKMVFTSGLLAQKQGYGEIESSSEDSEWNRQKQKQKEKFPSQLLDQVGKWGEEISGKLSSGQLNIGPHSKVSQTNITINNFSFNQIVTDDQHLKKRTEEQAGLPITQIDSVKKRKTSKVEEILSVLENVEPALVVAEKLPQRILVEGKVPKGANRQPKAKSYKVVKKQIKLNTAFKVLKKHLEKVKDRMIVHFREFLEKGIDTPIEKPKHQANRVFCKSNKGHDLIIQFDKEPPKQEEDWAWGSPANKPSKEEPVEDVQPLGRSARSNNHQILLNQIDQQAKMEKLEISFLSNIEKTFEKMSHNAEMGLYVYFSDYLKNLKKAVWKIMGRYNRLSRGEVTRLLAKGLRAVKDKFVQQKLLEWEKLSEHHKQYKIKSSQYPRSHLQNRVYYEVKQYNMSKAVLNSLDGCKEPSLMRKKYSVQRMLASDLKPDCEGKECACSKMDLPNFCHFKSNQSNWISGCSDKERKVECDASCGCGNECNNSFLYLEQYQSLGADVSLRQCWGIDFYSRKNLFHLLPTELDYEQKAIVIDNIVRELNFQGHDGWNLLKSAQKTLRVIQARLSLLRGSSHSGQKEEVAAPGGSLKDFLQKEVVDPKEKQICIEETSKLGRGVEVLVKQLNIKQLRECVRSFSKGLGVVCIKSGGIPKNSLIVKYFGEVYPPWYWYLKQDAIKSFLSQLKKGKFKKLSQYKNDYNMEFYNIFLEKHRSEPKGTELIVVDPIMKGNYASRLSHSCRPNCVTLPVVSAKQYCIGMYSQKEIRYGDELTFDYCSFTESEKEYQNSVCLCGSAECRGYYLSCNRKHFNIFQEAKTLLLDNSDKCFLVWNAVLLKSCVSSFDKFKEDKLMKYSIGENIFKNSPLWLRTWAFFVLEQIIRERETLYKYYFQENRETVIAKCLTDLKDRERLWRYEIENLFEQRLQNLIISLDKAINFLDRQKKCLSTSAPLLIKNVLESIRYSKNLLKGILNKETLQDAELQTKVERFVSKEIMDLEVAKKLLIVDEDPVLKKLVYAKLLLLHVSEYFRRHSRLHESHPALADILYFHSMTKVNFTMNQFSGFDIEIHVRDCDLTNPNKLLLKYSKTMKEKLTNTKQVIYTMKKKIAASYLWGQLVFWNKQTIEKPEASLSAGRRGTLTYPETGHSFLSKTRSFGDKFPGGSRKKWLESIRDKPGDYWPIGDSWSYENKEKVYGTFLSDDFFLDTNNRYPILENIDNGLTLKQALFNNIWKSYC